MAGSLELLTWLRATAESTRLRLLALCADRELSVSDLAEVLGQSEPRVSRHLRILTEAGLVERVRQGQWVHYRLARDTQAAGFIQGLLAQLDRADPALLRDRQRARTPGGGPTTLGATRLGRALREVLEAEWAPRPASVLLVGIEHPELLTGVAGLGGECAAVAYSRRTAQAARGVLEREGLTCPMLLTASPEVLGQRDIERLGRTFEAVVIDHLSVSVGALAALLSVARRVLSVGGRLWLFERYESGDAGRQRVVEHPIARLRRLLADAGLSCLRIRPIEADGQHVLAVSAVPSAGERTVSRAS